MTRTQKGYTFTSSDALKGYLSNLTLAGYAKVGKDELGNAILLAGAFEAAVPIDLVATCYGAVTGHYPDGTPFEKWKDSRHSRKHTKEWESDAILHGFLKSDDGAVSYSIENQENKTIKSRYTCDQGTDMYGSNRVGIMTLKCLWSVPCKALDSIVLDRLCELVEYDTEIVDRLKTMWEARKATGIVDAATVLHHRTVSYQDLEAAAALVEEDAEKERMQEITNELAKQTFRGKFSVHWRLPLDEISYLSELDETDYLNGGSIPYESPHLA